MADSYTQLYLHLVWATLERQPTLTAEIETDVYRCIRATGERLKATVLAVGGTDNHIHVLVRFPTTITIHQLAGQMKGSSSHLVTHQLGHTYFRWQGCYGAFTLLV
jgi:REP element-mobilizing transposase RayT